MPTKSVNHAKEAAAKATDQLKEKAAEGQRAAADAVDEQRERAAQALDTAAGTVERHGQQLPAPIDEYAGGVKHGLSTAAAYVREHDAGAIADDALDTFRANPMASMLVIGAVAVAGGILIAKLLGQDGAATDSAGGRPQHLLATASNGLGPKASETVMRMRDAAFNMALAKVVDTVEDLFPGFREHFEKA